MKKLTLQSSAVEPALKCEIPMPHRGKAVELTGNQSKVEVYLGLDLHRAQITVVRQLDGELPQPAQRFSREGLLIWVSGMVTKGWVVHSCYEAGCFGYSLHRELLAAGVHNLVVAAQRWCTVKTDKRDAREMCLRLERYIHGSTHSLCVVRVPSPEEEHYREGGRHRERLLKESLRAQMRGAGLMRVAGFEAPGQWWRPKVWPELREQLPARLVSQLEVWQQQVMRYQALQLAARKALAEQGKQQCQNLPSGIGALTWRLLQGEVCDWKRFKNRRAVGSYFGLCPSEYSSADKQIQGSINRQGNPRLRTLMVEAVWRLARFERGWRGFKKFPALLTPKAGARMRKRGAVAAARLLAIDLWRLATSQTSAAQLGFAQDFVFEGSVVAKQDQGRT